MTHCAGLVFAGSGVNPCELEFVHLLIEIHIFEEGIECIQIQGLEGVARNP